MRKNASLTKFAKDQEAKLRALRGHLARRTEKVEADLREPAAFERDDAECATARENDDVLAALGDEGRGQLALVERALARIEAGTYGACEACGKAIARKRLEACPYATRCLECAE